MKFSPASLRFLALLSLGALLSLASASSSGASNSSSSSGAAGSKALQARQSPGSAAVAVAQALGSLLPGLISQVSPFVLLLGLGALMMPQLSSLGLGLNSMGVFARDSRRR